MIKNSDAESVKDVLSWPIKAYGCILRGDETTSEDQIAECESDEVANKIAALWNDASSIDDKINRRQDNTRMETIKKCASYIDSVIVDFSGVEIRKMSPIDIVNMTREQLRAAMLRMDEQVKFNHVLLARIKDKPE